MKKMLLLATVCVMLSSCQYNRYYQMYQTKPISDIQIMEDRMVYEDDNCTVTYNFWKENGEIGFIFTNKTSENIYIHKDECFCVKNGIAYDYFQNRVYSSSSSYASTSHLAYLNSNASSYAYANYYNSYAYASGTSYNNSVGTSHAISGVVAIGTSIPEKSIICIPPHASKIVSEFDIKSSIFRSCDLYLRPRKNGPNYLSFNSENTPLTFGNRIAYSIGDSEELKRISNDFYVSKISNFERRKIVDSEKEKICGEYTKNIIYVFKTSGPDQFYIEYRNDGLWKH